MKIETKFNTKEEVLIPITGEDGEYKVAAVRRIEINVYGWFHPQIEMMYHLADKDGDWYCLEEKQLTKINKNDSKH